MMSSLRRIWIALSRLVAVPLCVGVAFVAVDLVLAIACIVALRQNVALRHNLVIAVSDVTPVKYQNAPSLIGTDPYGKEVVVQYHQDHRPTVVFTFSEDCPYCGAYWRVIMRLQPLAPRKLRLVYIDTHDGHNLRPDYLAANRVGHAPVLIDLTAVSALHYRTRIIPLLELLDGNGRVEWTHAGELIYDTPTKLTSQIEKFIPLN